MCFHLDNSISIVEVEIGLETIQKQRLKLRKLETFTIAEEALLWKPFIQQKKKGSQPSRRITLKLFQCLFLLSRRMFVEQSALSTASKAANGPPAQLLKKKKKNHCMEIG